MYLKTAMPFNNSLFSRALAPARYEQPVEETIEPRVMSVSKRLVEEEGVITVRCLKK